jgi:hypothetical protein
MSKSRYMRVPQNNREKPGIVLGMVELTVTSEERLRASPSENTITDMKPMTTATGGEVDF